MTSPSLPSRPAAGNPVAPLDRTAVSVLLVDDNPTKRLALRAVLAPLGYAIVEAGSGLEALRQVLVRDFAVILLDVCMPDMDGFETASLIRQRSSSEMTPIIFITAFSSDEIRHSDRYAEGAVDFIFAPVAPNELRAKIAVFANIYIRAGVLAAKALEVQASADQLRLLTDAAPIGIFQTDAANRYVYTNPRWSEITGLSPDEAAGRPWDAIIGADQRATLAAGVGEGAVDRTELCHRFALARPGEAPRIVLVTAKSIPDTGGGIAGWVGTVADVTAEAGAEAAMAVARDEATEASRLKSDFLANMSHEIRTPMNGVIGMTDLLLETDLDGRQRDFAQTVRNSGEALLAVINDILDFSKVEAGKLEIEEIEFDPRAIVSGVVDLLATSAQAKGLELIAMTEASVPRLVRGDPGRSRQVLTNLIGNAIKFTQAGEIVVRITEADVIGANTILRFEVADTGHGIPPDKLGVIFQPFVQADTSTSRRHGGTGLGLAISSQLVSLMGGDCGVSSRLGIGSTFWFTISVHADAPESTGPLPAADAALNGISALVVDDSAAQQQVLVGYLSDWGMTVTTADSGTAGLSALKAAAALGRPIAVALVDHHMADMDGLGLGRAIAGDPACTSRVVLMTGLSYENGAGPAEGSAVRATLRKPVHEEDLRHCLYAALELDRGRPARPTIATLSQPEPDPVNGRVLLAEDNPVNQKVALAMLSTAGYVVDTVLNGFEAVQAAATQQYDAILMDCQMPELNGYEATAAIRAQETSGRRTPIIALTAEARREDQERCLTAGMDSYLAKPVNKDALLALIARCMKVGAT